MRHTELIKKTADTSTGNTLAGSRRRSRRSSRIIHALVVMVGLTPSGGCRFLSKAPPGHHDTKESYYDTFGLQIEYPEVAQCVTPVTTAAESSSSPFSLEDPSTLPKLELSLEEAINLAVQQSPVLRSIGGTVVAAPQGTATVYDPGLTASSPTQGTEAALAAFDALSTQQLFWNTTDQPNNLNDNALFFGQPIALEATTSNYTGELSKTTATGAVFSLRHVVDYTRNNANVGFRRFSSSFAGWLEAEWRQPLLQGAGLTYNRIAGPTTIPGQYNGVLIARVNEDVSLADFEAAVIQLVSDVEQAYWDLVTAYRVLDTQVKGRAAAQQTFQYQQVRLEVGAGRSDEEAQARSQFYQFQAQVEAALGGAAGLYAFEQQLRYLIGLPASDGRLIFPTTELSDAKVVFDWDSALGQCLDRRVEIRRQRLEVKRRELELIASKLNRRPRLDFVTSYRWRGLGNHLIGSTTGGPLDNLYGTIAGGNFQEGRAGVEMNFPVGFRAAGVAIANARLGLQREQALLAETELRISHDLAVAARQIEITHQLLETNYNRVAADLRQVDVLRRRYEDGSDNINFLLQAQRQAVASTTDFYQSLANYSLAIRDFHREKGSLLAYNHVQLAEGPWAAGAAHDAYEVGRFLHPRHKPDATCAPIPLTIGPFDPSAVQNTNGLREAEIDPPPPAEMEMEMAPPEEGMAPPAGFDIGPTTDDDGLLQADRIIPQASPPLPGAVGLPLPNPTPVPWITPADKS